MPGAADATPKAAQGRGLMAAYKRVAPQRQNEELAPDLHATKTRSGWVSKKA